MPERIDEHNIEQQLSAFVDGELDAAQMTLVLDYLAAHREALDSLRGHQRLRASAASILRNQAPPPSASLRARVEQIAFEHRPKLEPAIAIHRSPSRIGWQWAAVAAMLIIGFAAGRWAYFARSTSPQIVIAEPPPPVVPVSIISHAAAIHADCSRLAMGLHTAGYPIELGGLADAVRRDLSSDKPFPDLSSIGFVYRGAGPCGSPLPNTIHLLYRAKDSTHALSVFVQTNNGQFSMKEGTLYTLSDPRSPFPMLGWRTPRVVYFLIADDAPTIEKARAVIAPAANLPLAPMK